MNRRDAEEFTFALRSSLSPRSQDFSIDVALLKAQTWRALRKPRPPENPFWISLRLGGSAVKSTRLRAGSGGGRCSRRHSGLHGSRPRLPLTRQVGRDSEHALDQHELAAMVHFMLLHAQCHIE